jgi:hypothetical protein
MHTIAYSATILDKKEWDFIMEVLNRGPHPGWGTKPVWYEPVFMDNFVYVEGDIYWPVDQISTIMGVCKLSYRVYTKDRCKLWTCGYRPKDEDIADTIFGPHDELGMVHP